MASEQHQVGVGVSVQHNEEDSTNTSSLETTNSINNNDTLPDNINVNTQISICMTDDAHDDEPKHGMRDPLFPLWTQATIRMHKCTAAAVTFFAVSAVRNPKSYLSIITVLSLGLIAAGVFTNFDLVLDLDQVMTPIGSLPQLHGDWMPTGFPDDARLVQMIFDADGANVLHPPQARRVLEAIDTIRSTKGFQELCEQGIYLNHNNEKTCRIISVSSYWEDHSLEDFDEQVGDDNNVDLFRSIISAKKFADGSPVLHDIIVGNYKRDNTTRLLTMAQSYMVQVELPNKGATNEFERTMLDNLSRLRFQWIDEDAAKQHDDPTRLNCHIITIYAYQLEILRTFFNDLYLVPISALLMIGFTCAIFYRSDDKVKSRGLLGLGSVVTICMSMCTGNGIMFLCGIPYTPVHQLIPFVVFGVGLDDTFIITGAFFRLTKGTTEERVRETMHEIGASIFLTTFTTAFAFFLGRMTSSLAGVHWVCLYSMTIIMVDFFYQITYFIAILALDDQRVAANKRDCCFWVTVAEEVEPEPRSKDVDEANSSSSTGDLDLETIRESETTTPNTRTTNDIPTLEARIMLWYSEFLMKPIVKQAVLLVFGAFFVLNCYSATLLKQHFNVADYVAEDSYLVGGFDSLNSYSSIVRPMGVYFRNFDQMDPELQRQMVAYVEELEALDQIGATNVSLLDAANSDELRPFCWVRDLPELLDAIYEDPETRAELNKQTDFDLDDPFFLEAFKDMTFAQKLDLALDVPTIREIYGADIVRDEESGNITASRCILFLKHLDLRSVQAQVNMLFDQRAVTESQPMNQLDAYENEWAMFSFNDLFLYWEAYAVAVDELISTIISGLVSATVIAFVFIPHWSAVCFVLPMIIMLYVDLLGTIRFFGLDIDAITYICVVVAIGLLVDFLMHVLLRYYESRPDQTREERVKETLQTMGASIMVGGFTTFLGVIPLILSSIKLFLTVFYAFFAMVTLGLAHGLILLPVVLSWVGPTMCVRGHHLAPKPDLPTSAKLKTLEDIPRIGSSGSSDSEDGIVSTPKTIAEGQSWQDQITFEIEV